MLPHALPSCSSSWRQTNVSAVREKRSKVEKQERQIIVAASKGDPQSYHKLFKMYYPRVFVLAMSKLRNKNEAEEAAQQTMIAVWNKLHTLQTPEAFGGWISRITINKCNALLRKSNKTVLSGDDASFDDVVETDRAVLPEAVAEQNDLQDRVGKALESLSDEQREAVMLYYYNQLSIKEISEATGVTGNTVKSRLSLARKYLKNSLASEREPSKARKYGIEGAAMTTLGTVLTQHFAALEPASEVTNAAYEQVFVLINKSAQPGDQQADYRPSADELREPYVNEFVAELKMCAAVDIPLAPAGGLWPHMGLGADAEDLSVESYVRPIREYRRQLESTEFGLISAAEALIEKL